jgi:hypothetical protein
MDDPFAWLMLQRSMRPDFTSKRTHACCPARPAAAKSPSRLLHGPQVQSSAQPGQYAERTSGQATGLSASYQAPEPWWAQRAEAASPTLANLGYPWEDGCQASFRAATGFG